MLITYKDWDLEVEYDFQPMERRTHNYPGCDASAMPECVKLNDIDITELLSEKVLEDIGESIIECLRDECN